ncbi:MAG TPA: pyridoxamine 5'-phosphate oxidase family protein [Stellaceae bacterium]|nr:pyridoxamine 5'-phosphate oxidase family protein [Stellaceae bacterium]
MSHSVEHQVTTVEQLEALYGAPSPNALLKELDYISDFYRAFIAAAPFVVLATAGPEGLDCTPRGDPPGFVRVVDRKTLMLPDRRGNNRVDTLRNLVVDPRIALLFLIPGVGETLRVNGRAAISVDPALCASFAMAGKLPRSVIVVTAERVYYQCPKALVRSGLWDPSRHVDRASLPSSGQILAAIRPGEIDAEAHDRAYPERIRETIY